MSANLTPQYRKAEQAFRQASDPDEKLACLRRMLRELPKHKGTDKLQADLKQRISQFEKTHAQETRRGALSTKIPRQGAARVVLIGGPNAGKSSLVRAWTRFAAEVAEYPFTTREPSPAMMDCEDFSIQLVDTPPITADHFPPIVVDLIRGADLVLLLGDLGSDDGLDALLEVWSRLESGKTRLARASGPSPDEIGVTFTQAIFVVTKCDLPGVEERSEMLGEIANVDLPRATVSIAQGDGLSGLQQSIVEALDIVRVYTRRPSRKEADSRPVTVRRGATLLDVARSIHKDLADTFQFARVWSSGAADAATVQGDYEVRDRDIVEIHTRA